MKAILTLTSSAALFIGGHHLGSTGDPAPRAEEELHSALDELVQALLEDDEGLFVGMDLEDAESEFEGSANLAGEHFIPLSEASFAPRGEWEGVVSSILSPEIEDSMTDLTVVLFVDDYDKEKTGSFVAKLARANGVALVQDSEDPWLYFNADDCERNLWVALGDDMIVVSVDTNQYDD